MTTHQFTSPEGVRSMQKRLLETAIAECLAALLGIACAGGGIGGPLRLAAGEGEDATVQAALASIEPRTLSAHLHFLGDDLLEGRGTGTRGHEIAARYVAAQMLAAELEPGTPSGWLQSLALQRVTLESATLELVVLDGRVVSLGDGDYVTAGDPRSVVEVDAPLTFVGYGITAPDLGHDDYAGVDVDGTVVAFLGGAPETLPGAARIHHGEAGAKARNALAHGAVGILRLWSPEEESAGSWETVLRSTADGTNLRLRGDPEPQLRANAWLGPRATSLLLTGGVDEGDGGDPEAAVAGSRVLPLRVRMAVHSRVTELESPNVIGLLRGADPVLRDEYVVVSAHLDHLGTGPPVAGDAIYNGVVDNASGVAALLAVARGAVMLPPMRRSLLFLATTAEEAGSLGARGFLEHPPVPADRVVANLNLDGGAVWPFAGLVGRGGEHSTLADALTAAASADVPVTSDPLPERFAGSDHYAFATAGVPALWLTTAGGPGRVRALDWFRTRYHSPSDDLAQPLDFAATARFARAVLLVVRAVADAEQRPAWNPGAPFGRPTVP